MQVYYDVAKCLQVKRGKCSLHVALYHALRNNKDEFVYSLIEKVDMKKFLDHDCLDHLYDQVSKIALVYHLCTNTTICIHGGSKYTKPACICLFRFTV